MGAVDPVVGRIPLVAQIDPELEESMRLDEGADVREASARDARLGSDLPALGVEIPGGESLHGLRTVVAVPMVRAGAVARDVPDGHVLHGAVFRAL